MAMRHRKRINQPDKSEAVSADIKSEAPAPEVVKKEKPLDQHNITSAKEAKALVERDYKTPLHVEYTVLQNGNVFYGNSRNVALSYARKFNLEYFDVKF